MQLMTAAKSPLEDTPHENSLIPKILSRVFGRSSSKTASGLLAWHGRFVRLVAVLCDYCVPIFQGL